ncbi:MAG TPA: hypothetical protein VIL50_00815, partial [Candidatus Limnocylindrales bacterium]
VLLRPAAAAGAAHRAPHGRHRTEAARELIATVLGAFSRAATSTRSSGNAAYDFLFRMYMRGA